MADPTNDTTHGEHPDDGAFEAFVIGALEGDAATYFEAHLPGCAACAARLRAEAALEVSLHEVHALASSAPAALALVPPAAAPLAPALSAPRARHTRRIIVLAAAALAIAATVALVAGRTPDPTPPPVVATPRPPPIAPVMCEVLLEQAACIEAAHRRGLVVAYPPGAGAPSFGGSPTRGPSSSPFPLASRKEDP